MSLLQRNTIVSALFAAMALPALAQTAAAPAPVQAAPVAAQTEQARPAAHGRHHQRHDGKAREARMEKRMAAFKTALKLNADQEPAWATYAAAIKPDHQRGDMPRPDRAAFAKMTTPERIDAMQAQHAKRQAHMDQRNQATKTFYAALNPAQQKTFDAETLKMHSRHGEGRQHEGKPHQPRHKAHGGADRATTKVDDPMNAK